MRNKPIAPPESLNPDDENKTLIASLMGCDPDIRERAALRIREKDGLVEAIAPVLIAVSRLGGKGRFRTAMQALVDIGVSAEVVAQALVATIHDPDEDIREEAAHRLGVVRGPVDLAVPALITLLQDPWPYVRAEAARSLEEIGGPPELLVPALIRALTDPEDLRSKDCAFDEYWDEPDFLIRVRASAALKNIGDRAGQALIAFLKHRDPFVRSWVAYALGQVGTPSEVVIPALVAILCDPDETVRDAAASALVAMGEAAISALTEALKCGEPSVRCRVAVILRRCHPAVRAVPALLQALEDENEQLRGECIKTLNQISRDYSIPDLLRWSPHTEQDSEATPIQLYVPNDLSVQASPSREMPALSPEDGRILSWFDEVELKEYLRHLQIFWCIGLVERVAFESTGPATGYSKLTRKLRTLTPHFNLVPLPTGASYICGTCLPDLDGLFDREPFLSACWSNRERGQPLRDEFKNGDRLESCWTLKARKAWVYVDRYLTLRGFLPQIVAPESGS